MIRKGRKTLGKFFFFFFLLIYQHGRIHLDKNPETKKMSRSDDDDDDDNNVYESLPKVKKN